MATVFLVAGLLTTGAFNTILNKLQDMACVGNCDDPNPSNRLHYEQPLWQTLTMFCGEASCLLVFAIAYYHEKRRASYDSPHLDPDEGPPSAADISQPPARNSNGLEGLVPITDLGPGSSEPQPLSGFKVFPFWLPTLCDLCATTLMNIGLIYTSASVYQMLRGAVVLFTGTFSVLFLRRKLYAFQWMSLLLVVCGVAIVGASSILFPPPVLSPGLSPEFGEATLEDGPTSAAVGVFMVLFAQLFTATQFVIEERVMEQYDVVPLLAVGLEGLFGLVSVTIGMPILYVLFGKSHPGGYFDIPVGFHQLVDNTGVWLPGLLIALSIAFFNWFGLSVTRSVSATARSTLDTCRTIIIWVISLSLGWEQFQWMQVLGFGVLIYGTFMFNGVVNPPFCRPEVLALSDDSRPLLVPTNMDGEDGESGERRV